MRTRRIALACSTVVGLLLTACGSDSTKTADTSASAGTASSSPSSSPSTATSGTDAGPVLPTAIGAGEGSLDIIAWAGYAENGSTDPATDWVTQFQKDSGCKVNVKIGNTSDEMFQLMQSGAFDGVSASGDASVRLIDAGLVAPVNTALIKNYADISSFLKDQPYNSSDGKNFGIPHGWGANYLMYNSDVVTTAPDSWGVVFDKASPYKGKITAYDAPIYIADAALYLKSAKPELGIKDPYSLTQAQFDAAVSVLKDQRAVVGEYWSNYAVSQTAFEQGSIVMGTTWQIIYNLAVANNAKLKTVLPKEGATGWSDTWMVSSKAKHPNCMYMWMDYITSPDVQAQVAAYFGEAPANPKACALISDKTHCDVFKATDEAFAKSVHFWATPRKKCLDGSGDNCVPFSEWIKAWTAIKG